MPKEVAYEGLHWVRFTNGELECTHCGAGWGRNLFGDVPPLSFVTEHHKECLKPSAWRDEECKICGGLHLKDKCPPSAGDKDGQYGDSR